MCINAGDLTNPAPGAEDAEPVALIPVSLLCLKRERLNNKNAQKCVGQCLYICLEHFKMVSGNIDSAQKYGAQCYEFLG